MTTLSEYPGWVGLHTRDQAPGAPLANGSRVRKVRMESDDLHPLGSRATVLGSVIGSTVQGEMAYGYFVEWDASPRSAVLVVAYKIEALDDDA